MDKRGKNEPLTWWLNYCLSCPWSTVLINRGFHEPGDPSIVFKAMSPTSLFGGAQDTVRNAIARLVEGS